MKNIDLLLGAICAAAVLAGGCGDSETAKNGDKAGSGAAAAKSSVETAKYDNLPMDCFKRFRKAVVDNDITPLLSITDGALLGEIKQHGIPRRTRKAMTLVTVAYEDIYVRQGNPAEALVRALFEEKGKEMCMDVKITVADGGLCKIADVEISPYTPLRDMGTFLAVCERSDSGAFAAMTSGAFREKYPNIPAGLTTPAENKTAMSGEVDDGTAKLSVDRDGLRGTFTMQKENSVWKVADMDDRFAKPMPIAAAKGFIAAVKDKKTDELGNFATEDLQKDKLLESESFPARFQSVKILSERITGSSAEVRASFDSEKESGEIVLGMLSEGDGWMVNSVSFPTVNAKKSEPAAEGDAPKPEGAADAQ